MLEGEVGEECMVRTHPSQVTCTSCDLIHYITHQLQTRAGFSPQPRGSVHCSRLSCSTELVITQQPGGDIIVNGFSPFLPSIFGYSHIPETNLLINLTDFEKPSDFVSETYACSLIGTGMEHRTTFVREGMYVNGSTSIVVLEACEW